MSEFNCGWIQDDYEIYKIVQEAYSSTNKDYLREQTILALVASGKDRKEAEEWLNQAEVGVDWNG